MLARVLAMTALAPHHPTAKVEQPPENSRKQVKDVQGQVCHMAMVTLATNFLYNWKTTG